MANRIAGLVTGLQHVGIPTNDMEATIAFYHSLGFETKFRISGGAAEEPVVFLQLAGLVIEAYKSGCATGNAGAVDHIAIDVTDIDEAFKAVCAGGFTLLNDSVQYLPFWENGVKFFTILGPNMEKVEFAQIL